MHRCSWPLGCWARVGLAVWCRPDGCPLVSRPPTLTAACLPLAGAGASHPVSARFRSVPTPRSAPSRPVSFSRIRSLSAWLHPPCPMRALSFPWLCLVILSCSPPPVRGLSCACARFGGCCRSPPCQNPHRTRSRNPRFSSFSSLLIQFSCYTHLQQLHIF